MPQPVPCKDRKKKALLIAIHEVQGREDLEALPYAHRDARALRDRLIGDLDVTLVDAPFDVRQQSNMVIMRKMSFSCLTCRTTQKNCGRPKQTLQVPPKFDRPFAYHSSYSGPSDPSLRA